MSTPYRYEFIASAVLGEPRQGIHDWMRDMGYTSSIMIIIGFLIYLFGGIYVVNKLVDYWFRKK